MVAKLNSQSSEARQHRHFGRNLQEFSKPICTCLAGHCFILTPETACLGTGPHIDKNNRVIEWVLRKAGIFYVRRPIFSP